ncbi:Fatty acid-binding protein [bioreactor metagenome]|uniref:Fatty acid-binding protein n=1 Tax=bioreactor metagenome TaxID=1076179 RepID=A0A645H937_9ZZZZ
MDLPNVFVVDSANLSTGHGLLVLAAAEAAERGNSPECVLRMLEGAAPRVETSFVLNRLDYMRKGGRCSSVAALGANLLKLHPCIEVVGGKISVTRKYRGSMEKVVSDYIHDRLDHRTDLDKRRAFLVNTATPELLDIAREELRNCGVFDEIIETKAGCTVFCHCGPNTLGVMFLRSK